MSITKKTITDKIESCLSGSSSYKYYVLQVREKNIVLENNNEISSTSHRYTIFPDHDISKITHDVVKAQFEAVMTDEVKANYSKFLKDQKTPE